MNLQDMSIIFGLTEAGNEAVTYTTGRPSITVPMKYGLWGVIPSPTMQQVAISRISICTRLPDTNGGEIIRQRRPTGRLIIRLMRPTICTAAHGDG
jgi:hypothetical protein